MSDSLFLSLTPVVCKHLPAGRVLREPPRRKPDTRTAQQWSDEEAIETLYRDDGYRSALAAALYRDAWLEDRARFGLQSDAEWAEREFYQLLSSGEFDRAAVAAALAVRARQPRPRRTVVDDRLDYYADLR